MRLPAERPSVDEFCAMLIPVRRVRVASPGDVRDASRQIVVHPYTRAIYVRMTDEEVREHQERRGR